MTTAVLIIFFISLFVYVIYKKNSSVDKGCKNKAANNLNELARLKLSTSGWPMTIIKSSSRRNESYFVDLSEQTCQCHNFIDERSSFKRGDPRRFCKHMVKAVLNNSSGKGMPPVIFKLFADAGKAGKGLYFEDYRIVTIESRDVVISKSPDGYWFSVIVPEGGEAKRYGYNSLELRWSYGRSPARTDEVISIIDRWSE